MRSLRWIAGQAVGATILLALDAGTKLPQERITKSSAFWEVLGGLGLLVLSDVVVLVAATFNRLAYPVAALMVVMAFVALILWELLSAVERTVRRRSAAST